jgi:thiol:disulfide interchange protein
LLVVLLIGSGGALADHAADHRASSAAPESGFNPLNILQQLTGNSVNEFLDPEIAYVLSTEARDANTLVARFDIADGYYLYRDKFSFTVTDTSGAVLGSTQLPDGKIKDDAYFGRMEVYYHDVEAVLQMQRATAQPVPLTLEVGYQGCADAGLCYPPMKKSVALTLPAAPAQMQGLTVGPGDLPDSAETVGELPEQDRIARALASGSTFLVLLGFFGFGLLLTFTPCVLPMLPILSAWSPVLRARTCRRSFRIPGSSAFSPACSSPWPCPCSVCTSCRSPRACKPHWPVSPIANRAAPSSAWASWASSRPSSWGPAWPHPWRARSFTSVNPAMPFSAARPCSR